ncbi:hypothetical protein [Desulfotalea psychrophila]|nr:hypothetical protein [Desulfotalea psychrophila]
MMWNLWGGSKAEDKQSTQPVTAAEQKILDDFEAVKSKPGQITGWDFARAFDFIDNYPDSAQAEILLNQMYATTTQSMKGLNYDSAVRLLERMPDHKGASSIIEGMYKLEEDYVNELSSTVIAYILQTMPDHPLSSALARDLASIDIACAYDFIQDQPESPHAAALIQEMFHSHPNIAVLLLQEELGHPQVATIFEGIYAIKESDKIVHLTPNAIIFILEVAPDHPKIDEMVQVFVQRNYVKAYDFLRNNPQHVCADLFKELLFQKKPSLEKLLQATLSD